MRPTIPPFRHAALCAAAFVLAAMHGQAQAATCTWTGSVSSAMSAAGNWAAPCNASGPANADSLVFPAGAANKTVEHDVLAPLHRYEDVTFATGYTFSSAGGNPLYMGGHLNITAPFTAPAGEVDGDGAARVTVQGSGLAEIRTLAGMTGVDGIVVTGGTHARLGGATGMYPGPIWVGGSSRFSAGQSVEATTLTVANGGTLAVSEPMTGAAPGSTVGSLTVTGTTEFSPGATFEYLASTTYAPGHLVAQGGLALNGATLRIVVEDPANPDAMGYTRTLAGYSNAALLSGRFSDLPATGALIEASNAPGIWYSISYGASSNPFVQITRVAAPQVPPPGPGGAAPIPVLGSVGLGLLSAAVAGLGALRRRRKGV